MVNEEISLEKMKGNLYDPLFPYDWKEASLYSLARWINGLAFRDFQFSVKGLPVIKIAEIKGGLSSQTKFTEQSFDESVRIKPGDLLFSWSGQPETSIDAFRWCGIAGWLNQHIFRVIPKEGINQTFLFYLLKYLKPNFIGIARNKQTTGLGHVTKRDLENIKIAYPSFAVQCKIAYILGALDDKIEVNRQINETLDMMVCNLFKDWFIDFGPVRAKMQGLEPYLQDDLWQAFPEHLDDKGKPAGWEIQHVSKFLSLMYGKSLPARNRRIGDVPVYGSGGITGVHDKALITEQAIIVGRKGTVGSLYWESRPCFPIDTVFYVKPKLPLAFCYYLLSNLPLRAMNTDAAVPGLNRENVYRLEFSTPSPKLVSSFTKIADKIRERMNACARESEILSQIRDALLPKLMSGEIQIQDAERIIGDQA